MRFPAKKQAVEQHHRDAYADGAVSDIEGWPMPSADVEIEKINNLLKDLWVASEKPHRGEPDRRHCRSHRR